MTTAAIQVVAALIRKDDHFLICRRPAHKKRGLLWEFPGGKVEAGEDPRQALVRECREELDIELEVGTLFWQTSHTYPDTRIDLLLYEATIASGTPQALEHTDICWVLPDDMTAYHFCPADTEIIEYISTCSAEGR